MNLDLNAQIRREKERIRQNLADPEDDSVVDLLQSDAGKVAERLRKIPPYRSAKRVLVSLARPLQQVRLNALSDRKQLVLPTPGLQKGFIYLDSDSVPVRKRSSTVRPSQGVLQGDKIRYDKPFYPLVDLVVTSLLAVGRDGNTLGTGKGHLDIQVAVMKALGWIDKNVSVVAVIGEDRVLDSLPCEETDVRANWIVTPRSSFELSVGCLPECGIVWDSLTSKDIRRNDALFYLAKIYDRELT